MAILDRSNRVQARAGHHVHQLHKRDTVTVSESASIISHPAASATVDQRSHHRGPTAAEQAIAAVFAILGIALIAIVLWRIGKWRRRKVLAASTRFNIAMIQHKEGAKPIHIDFDSKGRELEKPSIHIHLPAVPPTSAKRSSTNRPWTRALPLDVPTFPSEKNASLSSLTSPPPSYSTVGAPGSTPPATRSPPPALAIPLRPISGNLVVPSPRSSSFNIDSPLHQKVPLSALRKSGLAMATRALPRMMLVESTFKPSLSDELLIKVGETIRMLEEYEDEWCLVQRGNPADGQKGVVPRFCLREQD